MIEYKGYLGNFAFCKEQGREAEEPLTDEALVQAADTLFIELDKAEQADQWKT